MKATKKEQGKVQNGHPPASESTAVAKWSPAERADKMSQLATKVTGTDSIEFAHRIIAFLQCVQIQPPDSTEPERFLDAATAMLEMKPSNATEALLATQMIGVHEVAVVMLQRAMLKNQTPAGIDANVMRSTRLMRLFLEQVDAMQKLKGRTGQQKVIVEHVNVSAGGNAIVGAVSPVSGRGEGGV